MADQKALLESMRRVGPPEHKVGHARRQRLLLFVLVGLLLLAGGMFATHGSVQSRSTVNVLAH